MFKMVIVIIFSISSLGAFARTAAPTPRPAPTPKQLLKKGELFLVTAQGDYAETAISNAETYAAPRSAEIECQSGRARRAEPWDVIFHDIEQPGECVEIEDVEFCKPGAVFQFYLASANHRCL